MTSEVKVNIAIPSAGMVPLGFAASLSGLVAHFAAGGVRSLPECKVRISLRTLESSNWITNREMLARQAVDEDATHLMFIDDDMTFDPAVFDTLLGRRQPVVVTNYLIKTEPPRDFVACGLNGARLPTTAESTGLVPISYSGFGVSLIETAVLRAIPQPWFAPVFDAKSGMYTTEDNPFFEKVRAAGFKVYLDQDASKLVAHVGRKAWRWDQVTTEASRG